MQGGLGPQIVKAGGQVLSLYKVRLGKQYTACTVPCWSAEQQPARIAHMLCVFMCVCMRVRGCECVRLRVALNGACNSWRMLRVHACALRCRPCALCLQPGASSPALVSNPVHS